MCGFWTDFWPNLAATAVAIAVGVPIALWINRHAAAVGERQRRATERAELAHTLDVLERAISNNRTRLQRFVKVLGADKSLWDTGLDTSTWEAVQGTLGPEFGDAELRQRLAYHFSRTAAVVRLNDYLVRFMVGTDSAMGGAEETRRTLRAALNTGVSALDQEAPELVTALSSARAQLAVQAQPSAEP